MQSPSRTLCHAASRGLDGARATRADRTHRQAGCYGAEPSRMCSSRPELRCGAKALCWGGCFTGGGFCTPTARAACHGTDVRSCGGILRARLAGAGSWQSR